MRQIKFKGLRTDGKGWVYGSIVYPNRLLKGVWIVPDVNTCDFYPDQKDDEFDPNAEHHGITIGRFLEVIPESVGQFTGIHDKNGKEIYEGDLVKFEDDPSDLVYWDKRYCSFGFKNIDNPKECEFIEWCQLMHAHQKYYVIEGNIHENEAAK